MVSPPENIPAEAEGLLSSRPAPGWQALAAGKGRGWTLGSGRPLLSLAPYGLEVPPLPLPGPPFPGCQEHEGPSRDSPVGPLLSCR